jgi:hypothetical protein
MARMQLLPDGLGGTNNGNRIFRASGNTGGSIKRHPSIAKGTVERAHLVMARAD